ncbi:MAG: HD domain-containing phosphohydrolase [Terriglobia bacterium]
MNDRIMVVDDEPGVCLLFHDALHRAGYDSSPCASGEEALNRLHRERFDVVVMDLYMPGVSGMSLLAEGQRLCPECAFLVATGESDARIGAEAMKQGALDYMVKPIAVQSFVACVERARAKKLKDIEAQRRQDYLRHLATKRTQQLRTVLKQLQRGYGETVETLGALLDVRDAETAGHACRVCLYTLNISRAVNVPRKDQRDIVRAALLHDIGKIGIPDEILLKPERLTPGEESVMRSHVMIGYTILKHVDHLGPVAEIVLSHHEWFNGGGYPRGLRGEQIPLGARIFAVADTLDAMTTDRPYRQAVSLEKALEEIKSESAKQFDPVVVEAFSSIPPAVWENLHQKAGIGKPEPGTLNWIIHRDLRRLEREYLQSAEEDAASFWE